VAIGASTVYDSSLGIHIFASGVLTGASVQGSLVRRNNAEGIRVAGEQIAKVEILGKTSLKNGSRGIVVNAEEDDTAIIATANTVTGNLGHGIEVNSDGDVSKLSLADNTSTDNRNG
jgi:hypothetical protein